MKRQNTKLQLIESIDYLDGFPPEFDGADGICPIPVLIDPSVGPEIGLYWLDRTPFIDRLASLRPFQLFLRTGLFRSGFGPFLWLLFYVPNPAGPPRPFASVEHHLNPFEPSLVSIWRRLANQTHWHLTLVGAGNEVAGFFEFENHYNLMEALDKMERECAGQEMTDFMAAKQQLYDTFTMDDLYDLA